MFICAHRYHAPMGSESSPMRAPGLRPGRRIIVASRNTVITAIFVATSGCSADTVTPQPNAATTTTVAVVTEIIDGRPVVIPADAVPDGAEVTGRQASNGVTGSSAAEFTLASGDITTITAAVRSALESTGWNFVGRTYDDTMMQMAFTYDDGTILTWTLIEGSPLTGTVIVAEP